MLPVAPLASLCGAVSPTRWVHTDAPNLWSVLDEATTVAERHLNTNPREWWAIMGHTAQVPLQISSLRGQLDRHTELRNGTICEIGFNAGHSAIVWLEATHARLVEFDLLNLNYSHASRRWMEDRYPGRLTFHRGPSRLTVPQYASRVANGTADACDLWLVDGDHGKNVEHDFLNVLSASHAGTVIIADDASVSFPYVRRFWRSHVGLGSIRERSCIVTRVHRTNLEKAWCIGAVAAWAATGGKGAATLKEKFERSNQLSREERNKAYFMARRRRHNLTSVKPERAAAALPLLMNGLPVPTTWASNVPSDIRVSDIQAHHARSALVRARRAARGLQ